MSYIVIVKNNPAYEFSDPGYYNVNIVKNNIYDILRNYYRSIENQMRKSEIIFSAIIDSKKLKIPPHLVHKENPYFFHKSAIKYLENSIDKSKIITKRISKTYDEFHPIYQRDSENHRYLKTFLKLY